MYSHENRLAKKTWNHTPSTTSNPFQSRPFGIQAESEQSLVPQKDSDAQDERANPHSFNLLKIPVYQPGTEPPPPIQTKLTIGNIKEGTTVKPNLGSALQQAKGSEQPLTDSIGSGLPKLQREMIQCWPPGEDNAEPQEGSLRPALGKALMRNMFGSNWFATTVFKAMNFAMYVEGQPLSPKHNQVLHDSLITNKNGVLDTLKAENPYVMQTTGQTPIYLLGKYLVHWPLEKYIQYQNSGKKD